MTAGEIARSKLDRHLPAKVCDGVAERRNFSNGKCGYEFFVSDHHGRFRRFRDEMPAIFDSFLDCDIVHVWPLSPSRANKS